MAANMANSDESWRTQSYRQNMVTRIEDAILQCGTRPNKTAAVEMESQVFSRAESKDEYLGFVARLIIHIREIGPKPKLPGGPGGITNQEPPQGGQMNGGQQNLKTIGPMTSINQMGMMNQQGITVQIQQEMVLPGMAQQSGITVGDVSQQQQASQIQQQQIQHQPQMQQQHQLQQQYQMQQQIELQLQLQQQQIQRQMQQQIQLQLQLQLQQQQIQHQQQQMQQQIQQQHQLLQQQMQHQQQNPQQSQMMGQGFMVQQPQNPQMNQSVLMQGQQISNPQVRSNANSNITDSGNVSKPTATAK